MSQQKTNKFIHFRTQSSYSMLESTIKAQDLVDLAKKDGMSAICLVDRGNLFGSLEFSIAAKSSHIQPIHGVILNIKFKLNGKQEFAEILVIAKNDSGYRNLLKLVSITFAKNEREICNHINLQDLTDHNDGLIVLSGFTEGIVGKLLLNKQYDLAFNCSRKLQEIFGDRFYFEIMRHDLDHQRQIENSYLRIASKLSIPLIATNQVLFANISDHDAHDVLLCISTGSVKEEQNRKRISPQSYFKSQEEMIDLFSDIPEAIENTIHLAERCSVASAIKELSLPRFPCEISEEDFIKRESQKGLEERLLRKFRKYNTLEDDQKRIRKKYFDRLSYELKIICKMKFAGYFLIVSDFIRWSKTQKIAVGPGRGSGAGSIIAWSLQITDLDPIEFRLLFERFLNPARVSMPDFDIDFCQERRREVIDYVRSKYGNDSVGQIITFGKLQAKAVIKDVSRVLALPYSIADYITTLVPFNAVKPVTLSEAIEEVGELKHAYQKKGLYNIDADSELIKQVLDISLILEGLHRHSSIHAAGIVIANDDMINIIPVCRDQNSEMLISQYSMKYCELSGLVKFDFLGLQTLTLITNTLKLIKNNEINVDVDYLSFDDKKTFSMLSKGLTTGVFQFESIGMKSAVKKLKPDNINDIIALGALYRPGPMENIPTYIACKEGSKEVDYLHPLLESILKSTYGVIIYQEQVMEIAQCLSGYSLGEADLLRRAMGKKVKSEMDDQQAIFVDGAVKNGVDKYQAKSIFAIVAKFAGYGFNKSHASAYGVISYQTAYLKANFPVEFLVASLNLDIHYSDKVNIFIQEARIFGIDIIVPNINKSSSLFSIDYGKKKSIIYGIGAIKNVPISFGEQIKKIREEKGNFTSIMDFVEKINPKLINKRILENLIKAGCFDLINERASLLESIQNIMSYCLKYHEEQRLNQFSLIALKQTNADILTNAQPLSVTKKSILEFEAMGLLLYNHPISEFSDIFKEHDIKDSDYIYNHLSDGRHNIKIAGVIIKKDARMSQRGRFITILLSDQSGIIDTAIYKEETVREYSHLINVKSKVIVDCDIFKNEGGLRITINSLSLIEDLIESSKRSFKLYPQNVSEVNQIMQILNSKQDKKKANSSVSIFIKSTTGFTGKLLIKDLFLSHDDMSKLSDK